MTFFSLSLSLPSPPSPPFPPPSSCQNDESVTVVVGHSFDQVVKDETKDVLLEVSGPRLGASHLQVHEWVGIPP